MDNAFIVPAALNVFYLVPLVADLPHTDRLHALQRAREWAWAEGDAAVFDHRRRGQWRELAAQLDGAILGFIYNISNPDPGTTP